ncbi:MAG TPA: 2-phospho-L-lactate guanylyltransferase [Acidimicrobiia bacterium]|nr:2-phospho-L-lactate guanylyltransferase [Acidimicrobiia bacterium]
MFHDASRAATTGAVIPIRAFALGKARLAAALDGTERAALGRQWAEQVVHAAGDLPIVVVSSDPDVRVWANGLALDVLDDPGSLDDAARVGRDHLRDRGCSRVVVAHADLPRARDLARLARDGSQPVVAIVPCHRDDGTPVLSVPAAADFRFAYGADSFRRHAAEARRLGLGVRVVRDRDLAFDVDVPDDLVALGRSLEASAASLAS